jgi:hypothetical protein
MGRSQDGAAGAAAAMALPVPPRPGRPGELHCGRPARGKPGKGSCLSGEPAWGDKRRAGQGGRTCGTGLRRRRHARPGTDAARQGAVAAACRAGGGTISSGRHRCGWAGELPGLTGASQARKGQWPGRRSGVGGGRRANARRRALKAAEGAARSATSRRCRGGRPGAAGAAAPLADWLARDALPSPIACT